MAGWHHDLMDMSLSKLREVAKDREAWRAAVRGVAESRTRLSHSKGAQRGASQPPRLCFPTTLMHSHRTPCQGQGREAHLPEDPDLTAGTGVAKGVEG